MRPISISVAVCLVLTISASLLGCGGDGESTPTPVVRQTALAGVVTDTTGARGAGATISVNGKTATAGADGSYSIDFSAAFSGVAEIAAPGFVTVQRPVAVRIDAQSRLDVVLKAEAAAVMVDVTNGGEVTGERGARVTIPEGALVDGSGNVVTGEVAVHLTPLDPSIPAEFAAYPGDLKAETATQTIAMLESFGVMDVTIRQGGAELDVADGKTLSVRIPAPATGRAPATTKLWSFDEARALWIEEGVATLDVASNTYEAELPHLSPWNCDDVAETTCVIGRVTDTSGNPIPGGYIKLRSNDIAGEASTFAGGDGTFCVSGPVSSNVTITASHPDGGGAQKTLDTGDVVVPPSVEPGASCPATGCTDAGDFPVQVGSVTTLPGPGGGGPGTTVSCGDVVDPLAGTCAEKMGDIFLCFNPSGECVTTTDSGGQGSTTTWDNGARFETTSSGGGTMFSSTWFGPDGAVCGTMSSTMTSQDPVAFDQTISDTKGNSWKIRIDDQDGTVVICDDDTEIVLSSDERDAFEACNGGGGDTGECSFDQSQCTTDSDCGQGMECCSLGAQAYCLPDGQCAETGVCQDDNDCTGDEVCCEVFGVMSCQEQSTCDAAQGCTSDASCDAGQKCCDFGGFSTCAPESACPQ